MAIAYVSSSIGNNAATGTSIATAALSTTNGNLIVVCIAAGAGGASETVTSVTDTATNTYVQFSGAKAGTDGGLCDIWYAKNITGNAANVVTANFSATLTLRAIHQLQYSGLNLLTPEDTSAQNANANAGSIVSSSFTTITANEVIVAFGQQANDGGTWTPDTGYTSRTATVNPNRCSNATDKIVSAVQTGVTVTMSTDGGNAPIGISVATFKSATLSTVSLAQGSFALTGQDSVLSIGKTVVLAVGSFALTGFSATLTLFQKWIKDSKNSSTMTNTTKNSSSWSNESKDSSTFDNETKN